MTRSTLHTDNPQILGATLRSLSVRAIDETSVATATWHRGFIHPWAKEALSWNFPASFPSQSSTISLPASGAQHYAHCRIRGESDSYVYMLIRPSHKCWCRMRITNLIEIHSAISDMTHTEVQTGPRIWSYVSISA